MRVRRYFFFKGLGFFLANYCELKGSLKGVIKVPDKQSIQNLGEFAELKSGGIWEFANLGLCYVVGEHPTIL
jgi:hypothetical protein